MPSGLSTLAPGTTAVPGEPSAPPRRRRATFWRSPPDQPGWARPALVAVAAIAALLYTWNITGSGLAPYYSVAARSMSESWKAFLFTSFDPAATVTLDKIGGFLWPQALSARLFGFHDWALTLPQCVEGVVSVLVLYRVVRRWQGAAAGLIAAGLLTVTPVAASMFGHALLDCSLTMCLVLAADQYQKAVLTGRPGPLLLSGLWIGLGFQAKMMQAWIIVPALAVAYLVAAPHGLRRRLGQLAAAGGVLLAVSLSWVALMTFTPEDSRPYADGSTDNSAFAMVFGYNGFDRFHEGLVPGSVRTPSPQGTTPAPSGGASEEPRDGARANEEARTSAQSSARSPEQSSSQPTAQSSTQSSTQSSAQSSPALAVLPGSGGWTKLFGPRFTTQVGWLYPLALTALAVGLVRHRGAARTDRRRAGYLMWGGWLATSGVVLSALSIPHTAYVALLAPPLAALAAAGATVLWRTHRAARGGPRAWLLPAVVVVQEMWTLHIAAEYTEFAPWLVPLVLVASVVACGALVHTALPTGVSRRTVRRVGLVGLASGCVAFLVAPVTWSASVLDPRYGGSAFDAYAGPPLKPVGAPGGGDTSGGGGTSEGGDEGPVKSNTLGGRTAASTAQGPAVLDSLSADQRKLVDYVRRHNRGAEYTFSANSWEAASRYIYAEALPVLPLGGFTAGADIVSLAEYRDLVRAGRLRFALIGTHDGTMSGTGGGQASEPAPGSSVARIDAWVKSACAVVDPAVYGAHPASGAGAGAGAGEETLYDCASAVR
ncbi:ArnT family glycosyltransferase [Streptomyces sp. CRN 30]|uniref:ArnT family glycosyltransferase n=1 Tax=Streptomyces sp. CRN 30 TaxID=3075613 RepID=UPI002A7EE4B4|nr:glycosyltransferase family 39 protein [Streptomyces sp. CRN 30]